MKLELKITKTMSNYGPKSLKTRRVTKLTIKKPFYYRTMFYQIDKFDILAQIENGYSTEMLNRHFPSLITMNDLLEEFVTLVSNPLFYEPHTSRLFHFLEYRPKGICCKSYRLSNEKTLF